MKYRHLTQEELEYLENDLKQFLIINHVYAEEWEQLNREQPEKATQLIELFSDHVLQRVYEKVRFLEHRSKDACFVFNCKKESMELIAIQVKDQDPGTDLSSPESIHEALTTRGIHLSFFKNEKQYSGSREEEIHRMLETGCVNSSESFWVSLDKALN